MIDLSIIIVSYNTRKLLDSCLSSLYSSLSDCKMSCEVLVVDNASTDGSVDLLKNKYTRVIKIFNKKNVGFGIANNIGIRNARGKYILLLNSDIIVHKQSIKKLFSFAIVNPRAFIGGKLLNADGSSQPSCGPMYTLPVIFAMLFLRGDKFGLTRSSPLSTRNVDWISGACILAAKDSFISVGLFDEDIFMYMEEIDLLYRAKQKGFAVLFYPGAVFTHYGAASSGNSITPVVNIYRGLRYFYRKHRSVTEQSFLMVLLQLKARIAVLVAVLTGNRRVHETYESALRVVSS